MMMSAYIVLFTYLIRIIVADILYPEEKLVRVQNPKEANGKSYFVDFIGLAQQYGYQAEQHFVTTEDGYILEIFRIPKSPWCLCGSRKAVILLGHGIAGSSDIWALYRRSLGYFLADAGYDVWFMNNRGNTYARNHTTLSPEDPQFWNFSWHEMGIRDYPATIDYILEATNKSSLSFFGHSTGATGIFVLLAEKPEYNNKINVASMLSPVVYWEDPSFSRAILFDSIYSFRPIDPTGLSEFLPQSNLFMTMLENFCMRYDIATTCTQYFGLTREDDLQGRKLKELIKLIHHYPAGTSTKTEWHFLQNTRNGGKFQKYDYGVGNWQCYGQWDPPQYKISNVKTNLVVFYADNDFICVEEDIDKLVRCVSTNVTIEHLKYPTFSYFAHMIVREFQEELHNKLLLLISKYKD